MLSECWRSKGNGVAAGGVIVGTTICFVLLVINERLPVIFKKR